MSIPESQLKTWSNQGAITTAKATHESIRNALESNDIIRHKNFEVYLQGSYRNSTNIRGDSDVDIIVQLNSSFKQDLSLLSEHENVLFKEAHSDATYLWEHFRDDVFQALKAYYGTFTVYEGNKSLKIAGKSGRLSADVVICLLYRKYQYFRSISDQGFIPGIIFRTSYNDGWIINFPKPHYDNGVRKNKLYTNGWYKPIVRIFKNARTFLVNNHIIAEDIAPSYFLECLLYNVPNGYFSNNFQESIIFDVLFFQYYLLKPKITNQRII